MDFRSILLKLNGSDIGDIIHEQNKVFDEIAKYIKSAYTKKNETEIKQIIKTGNIREFYSKDFTEGLCYPYLKTMCIKPYIIENILKGKMSATVIHEAIHLLRGIQHSNFFEKNIIGFEEGSTEYMTVKAMGTLGKYGSKYLLNNKGQKIKYNIPSTSYPELTSIMAQLGIIFGEEKLQEFAFGENNDLLKNLQSTCGKDFFENFRKRLNKYTTPNQIRNKDILELQSELLTRCYTSKFSQIKTIEEAATLFNELQSINKVRAHFEEDTSFKDFYEEQYKKCTVKFGNDFEKIEHLKYQEIEFLNVTTMEEIKNNFSTFVKNTICDSNINLEEGLELLKNTRRYGCLYQDTLYQILVYKDTSVYFKIGNEKEGTAAAILTRITNKDDEIHKLNKSPNMPQFNSTFFLKKDTNNDQNYILIVDRQEIPLKEINLGVTQKDAETYYSFVNSLNQKKTFKQKFLNFFLKKKTKLLNEPKSNDNQKEEKDNKTFIERIKNESTAYPTENIEPSGVEIPIKSNPDTAITVDDDTDR